MRKIRALIVDDEAPARRKIRFHLRDVHDFEVAGECRNGADAIAFLKRDRPDVVFLDVEMRGMSGFDVVRALYERGIEPPPIVFVTAWDEFAVQAFEVMALDYLLKPFSETRFMQSVERLRSLLGHGGLPSSEPRIRELIELLQRPRGLNRLLVRDGDKTIILPLRDVRWISAARNYLELHTEGSKFLVRKTMGELENELAQADFVRIHRSTMVALRHIRSFSALFNNDHLVVLDDGTELIATRTYYPALVAALQRR